MVDVSDRIDTQRLSDCAPVGIYQLYETLTGAKDLITAEQERQQMLRYKRHWGWCTAADDGDACQCKQCKSGDER